MTGKKTATTSKDGSPGGMEAALGLTHAEALEMKRAIQFLEISAPQRWERGERIELYHAPNHG